jgi:oligopeptide/dipeptide ABC transporter ATP-binding protein
VTPLLEIRNLGVAFVVDGEPLHAVVDASLSVKRGQRVGVIGESGSGKSVMARTVLRLHNPHLTRIDPRTSVMLDGADILRLDEAAMLQVRGDAVSMIFQNPMHSLNPSFTIGTQMRSVMKAHRPVHNREALERAIEALAAVDLPGPAELVRRYPHELSGGQRQRVMVAMAVLCEPDLVIADEPTSSLDVTAQDTVLAVLKRLSVEQDIAVMMITHDMGVVARFCEEVSVMYGGRIVETGPVEAIFSRPGHPYTAALMAATPDPSKNHREFKGITGTQATRQGATPTACAFVERCPFAQPICSEAPPPKPLADGHTAACHFAGTLPLHAA